MDQSGGAHARSLHLLTDYADVGDYSRAFDDARPLDDAFAFKSLANVVECGLDLGLVEPNLSKAVDVRELFAASTANRPGSGTSSEASALARSLSTRKRLRCINTPSRLDRALPRSPAAPVARLMLSIAGQP